MGNLLMGRKTKIWYLILALPLLLSLSSLVYATDPPAGGSGGGGGGDIAAMTTRLNQQISGIAGLLRQVSYVAGVGFLLAGVIQFKAHKDNPAQVPLSKPIVYLVVGAFLAFLPAVLKTTGKTIFAEDQPGVLVAPGGK